MDLAVFGANLCAVRGTERKGGESQLGRGEASEEDHGREAPIMEIELEMREMTNENGGIESHHTKHEEAWDPLIESPETTSGCFSHPRPC
jgi:hypothetical protein